MRNKPINIKFPIEDDNHDNNLFSFNFLTKDAIKSKLLLLLTTNKTERFMRPKYGINLKQYIFEQNDNITLDDITSEIRKAVSKDIQNVEVKNVQMDSNPNENYVSLRIHFTYNENAFRYDDKLDLTFEGYRE